ncbi:tetraspanin-18-like isoform X2 [Corythoichthys intestinalis]|uniref:tetraspanin-18-like isoform X2 n=1 Tax=Corythoichthys intestinalis TaxID=161448 RepID=UPI0025A56607|nr:tetraspanin-18-like isoform X2 [Corythoichthys intestinalis]
MMRTRIEPAAYGQHTPNVECADHYPATRYYKKAKIRTQTTGDCLSCIKYTLLILNTFFVMTGCLFAALWALTQLATDSALVAVLQTKESLVSGLYFMLGVGGGLFIVGFVGCCGALRGNRFLLLTFCMLIFVVLIVEMAGIGLVLVDRSEFEEKTMSDNMKSKFGAEFTKANQDYVEAWRAVMRHYECCGISRDDFTPENVPRCCRVDDKDICDDTTPTHKQVTAIAIAICFFRGLQHV